MLCIFVVTFLVYTSFTNSKSYASLNSKEKVNLVIDHDTGTDDAIAIFMALLYEKYFDGPKVVALTTTHGNVDEPQVYINTQRILDIAGRRDVPIFRGSQKSLVIEEKSDSYFGTDGLGMSEYHGSFYSIEAQPGTAANALIELSKTYKGNLVIFTSGPLTNIALAIKLDPQFLGRLKHLYVAAGHLHDKHNPNPEFNVIMDVEAYHVVAAAAVPEKVTLIPFSQTKSSLNISTEWRKYTLGKIDTEIMRSLNAFEEYTINQDVIWHMLDPVAMAVVINDTVIEDRRYTSTDVVLCGQGRGLTNHNITPKEIRAHSNAQVIYAVNEDIYKEFLLDLFSADIK